MLMISVIIIFNSFLECNKFSTTEEPLNPYNLCEFKLERLEFPPQIKYSGLDFSGKLVSIIK